MWIDRLHHMQLLRRPGMATIHGRADRADLAVHRTFAPVTALYTLHTIRTLVIDQNARDIARIPVSFPAQPIARCFARNCVTMARSTR